MEGHQEAADGLGQGWGDENHTESKLDLSVGFYAEVQPAGVLE